MQMKLIGIQRVEFQNRENKLIKGVNLFCAFKDENTEGLRAEKVFIKEGIDIPECKVNDMLEISFNMKGKVEKIQKL